MAVDKKPLSWLHISDVHFSGLGSYDQNRLVSALLKSLPNLTLRFGKPDFVFFTGDVAKTGNRSEYAEASSFFDKLLSALELKRSRLLVVPGNHDVDRSQSNGLSREFQNRRAIDDLFNGKSVYHIEKRQNAFKTWYEEYFPGRKFPTNTTTYKIENFEEDGFLLEVWGLNSAALSFDDQDQGRLLLAQRCIDEAIGADNRPDLLRLALMHHPITWLSEVERSGVKATLNDNFDLLLHGHLHENEVEIAHGSSGQSVTVASGALYQGSQWPNVANFGKLTGNDLRISPIRYHETPREIWTADTSLFPDDPDYAGRFFITRKKRGTSTAVAGLEATSLSEILRSDRLSGGWQTNLLAAPSGKPIYTEPRLSRRGQSSVLEFDHERDSITVQEIIEDRKSYIIESRSEYGGSTLLGRLGTEIKMRGGAYFLGDARRMPNYKKKLQEEIFKSARGQDGPVTVLLDNVNLERDRKLISELGKIDDVLRVVAIATNRGLVPSAGMSLREVGLDFEELYLWTLSRAQIRELAESFFDTDDFELASSVTQKVYDDLLGLCIPLTPSNVVMYMKILFVDGSFIPLNRVDILQKFLLDSLRKPSDSFTGSFNYQNKIDLIASFARKMYDEKEGSFSVRSWIEFCDDYKARTLLGFDSNQILDEIVEAKIFGRNGNSIYFRYGFFYSFALGIALKDDDSGLEGFLADQNYTAVEDVLDVITALKPNDSRIMAALSRDLGAALSDFERQLVRKEFDPLSDALWAVDAKEEEQTWAPIAKAISDGPEEPKRIDSLKTSLLAEARTANQKVTIRKFMDLEYALVIIKQNLSEVLKNVNDVGRDTKVEAYELLLWCELCAFQIGTLFAPELAKSKLYRWGAMAFIDFDKAAKDLEPDSHEAISAVVLSLSRAVSLKTRQTLGFQKLGGIFAERAFRSVEVGFLEVVNFYHLIGARAEGWENAAEHLLAAAEPGSIYLWMMLHGVMDELKHDVVRMGDRAKLKRLVAYTRAKRAYATKRPTEQQISKHLQRMEKQELIG